MEFRRFVLGAALALCLLAFPAAGRAQQLAGHASPPDVAAHAATPAPTLRLAAALAAPNQELVPATVGAVDQIAAMAAWNDARKLPYRIGFPRALPSGGTVDLGRAGAPPAAPKAYAGGMLGAADAGQLAWGVHVRVEQAFKLRLHLENVQLPAGTVMMVSGATGAPRAFGLELLSPSGNLWTPSVAGESLYFEIHLPAGATMARFAAREVMELFNANPAKLTGIAPQAVNTSCLVDAGCVSNGTFPGITNYRHGVAALEFVVDGTAFLCSGGLLANKFDNSTPYLLTANHCFSTQDAASSLEATFDYYTDSCNGNIAPTLPVVNGSVLLATKSADAPDNSSDFTFVQLDTVISGRWYLGWNANTSAVPQGVQLNRLSFPAPDGFALPAGFSRSSLQTGNNIPICTPDRPRPQFLYGTLSQGATFGGSSGAPLLLASGEVVGQLGGGCAFTGHDPENGCDYANSEFDGAFSVTFPFIQQWLNPALKAQTPCTASSTTLCIDDLPNDHRFSIKASYATSQGGGLSGTGTPIPLTGEGITQGGILWFFNATNPEMLIKVIDACSLTSTYWVFYSATTNVGLTITVTDTQTGHFKTYVNSDLSPAQPVQDINAFACN